ncbi:MAG TPA: exclusion suppressor FxsA [Rhodospirillaceae bacterium]|nr:exclusion suppressor FxsA [Rhodospirillaceae bacterium]
MAPFILILFVAVPIIEIGLFVQVGGVIGLWPTLAVVILTAVLGTALLRHQGLDTLRRVQDSLAQDRLPVAEMFDGLCLLMAGALLLTPGFMTDAFGFVLFVPPFRAAAAQAIGRYVLRHGRVHVQTMGMGTAPGQGSAGPSHGRGPGRGPVIDGDFEEVPPDPEALEDRDHPRRPGGPPESG